jgi:drug/metabolite transporter (DMT)-like permease
MTTLTERLDDRPQIVGAPSIAPRRHILGSAMVVLSAVAIAVVPSFAKLAYEGGSNTLTVITARSIMSVALIWLVMMGLGQTFRLGREPMMISLASGVCYAVMLCGYLGAVAFIPVNTVILIYFIHPLPVGLLAALRGDESVGTKMVVALLAAFVGLGLAIGFTFDALDLTGLGLAVLAMVTCVFVIMGSGQAAKQAGGLAVVFYMMLSAAVTLALLFLFFGTFELPATAMGWLGFSGVAIGSTIGTLAFFCAIPMIGIVRATMISNVEPPLGILFALFILGERISALQVAGVALVLAAILIMEVNPSGRSGGH